MAAILVIEDEPDLARVLEFNLKSAGHVVTHAATGRAGLQQAKTRRPDLILLDLMLPDISGFEVCKALRRDPTTATSAIVMLTAKGEEMDRVLGFELGVDDYVVKPFSVRELLLRINAILGRRAKAEGGATLTHGALAIDEAAHRVFVAGVEIELTALEFRLLLTLCERRGRVQSREALLADVWGITADVTSRTVDTHVKRLREKIGAAGDYIETVRGVGYRFSDAP